MSITSDYTATHRAFVMAADRHDVRPFTVRVLVALAERPGGVCDVHRLADVLAVNGSALRREIPTLEGGSWVVARAADAGRRRQGIVTVFSLTKAGRRLADEVLMARRGLVDLAREGARG